MTADEQREILGKTSAERHVVRGSIWAVAVRWSVRLLGLASTVILARLLTPTDYGIVAIATIIVGLVEVFARTGQGVAIVRHPNPTREYYDSAWTVSLLLWFLLGLTIWALTPLATIYFHEPRSALVMQILALRTMLSGLRNIGVVNFQRNLQFKKQFWFNVTPSLVSFGFTIGAAVVLQNYWALVIGILIEFATELTLSYVMEPYRPRLCFSKVREIWSFSFWVMCRNIGGYFSTVVDRVAIGGVFGSTAMGHYNVALEVATSPSKELVGPITAVLFPVMATIQHDIERRRELYLAVLYWSALICTSTAIGVGLIADDMVDLVLGHQWADVKPLMGWLALSFGILGMGNSVYSTLDIIGLPWLAARLQWTRLLAMALTIFPVAYYFRDLEMVAAARLIVAMVITPTMFLTLMKPLGLTAGHFAAVLARPMIAGLLMAAVVLALNSALPFTGNVRLLIDIVVGMITYGGSLMILWILIGRPKGPEYELWRGLSSKLAFAR